MKIDRAILNHGLTPNQSLFLGCWYNMCHEQSLDSDRVSILTAKSGLKELLHLYSFGSSYRGNDKRKDVAFELSEILSNDIILQQPLFLDLVNELKKLFSYPINSDKIGAINKQHQLITSIIRELLSLVDENYLKEAFILLDAALPQQTPDKETKKSLFKKIQELCNSIMGYLMASDGGIQEALSFYRNILTKNTDNTTFEDRYNNFKNAYVKSSEDYLITYKLESKKLASLTHNAGDSFNFGLFKVEHVDRQLCKATAQISASSYTIAGMKGFDLLGELVDAVSYTIGKENVVIRREYVAKCVRSNISKPFHIHRPIPNPNYEFNKDKFIHFLKSLDNSSNNKNSGFKDKKLASAFRLFRIGEASDNIESKYTSYWTALESISRDVFPDTDGDDGSVIAAVVPCISSDYVCKRLTAFLRALHNINNVIITTSTGNTNIRGIPNSDFYSLLKDNDFSQAIIASLNDYPYFQLRLEHFISYCQKPELMGIAIEAHEEKVARQLKRLYRARNVIVHNADRVESLELLCATLEHYFKSCLNSLVDLMSSIKTIESPAEGFIRYKNLIRNAKIELNPALRKRRRPEQRRDRTKKPDLVYADTKLLELIKLHE